MKIIGIIPSRFGSTRFPGKPLVKINGKTMIERVYHQAKKAKSLTEVIVATDDERIFKHVKSFGGKVIMTSSAHQSGTERCAEVINKLKEKYDVVINIQGDEPFINPEQINQLSLCFEDVKTDIATLIKKIDAEEELFNLNRPKVDIDENNFAKMFSREAIPPIKNVAKENWLKKHTYYKHIGIYGYRTTVLKKISQLPPSPLEIKEKLEQLRWLENGYTIKIAVTTHEGIAIDTPADLEKITFK
ncbi:MAG: 3-deoxy-manno-octulosonate cytidylyltransferase [Flavobacteriales bacterium CG_4_9_14_3_um_filter_32_8]|nr:MAG: 3-deoxy-manno-octulosonate cytidylyltransferase [Flavobacteriales bacterium CG_4_9_14_3_um_filter_32_8]